MLESVFILNLLLHGAGFILAVYGALLLKKHLELLGPLWGLAIVLADRLSDLVGTMIRHGGHTNYDNISSKLESFWGVSFSEFIIYAQAIDASFEFAAYLLLTLVLLSDLAKLLKQKDIAKPKFLPDWSKRTVHIVGALALLCYLLSLWLLYFAFLMAGAV